MLNQNRKCEQTNKEIKSVIKKPTNKQKPKHALIVFFSIIIISSVTFILFNYLSQENFLSPNFVNLSCYRVFWTSVYKLIMLSFQSIENFLKSPALSPISFCDAQFFICTFLQPYQIIEQREALFAVSFLHVRYSTQTMFSTQIAFRQYLLPKYKKQVSVWMLCH